MLPAPGDNFGPYQIADQLGSGGMGMVFRATDTRLQREVAIKVLAAHLNTPGMKERFLREARAASSLNHPNICTVFDMGEHDGSPYIVMELLHGKTLKELTTGHPLPIEQIINYGMQTADALAAAHLRGIVHRDIKSANLMVVHGEHESAEDPGQIKVLDFGLAKMEGSNLDTMMTSSGQMGNDGGLTQPGSTVGTIAYMSPEQARGEPLDARTDIFSLGAVLYEMATGKLPFPGATSALVFVALLSHEPVPIRDTVPDFPRDLEKVILRCLIKDRDRRIHTAKELKQELHKLTGHASSGNTPVAVVEYMGGPGADPETRPAFQKRGGPSHFQRPTVVPAPNDAPPPIRTSSAPETRSAHSSGVSSGANRRAASRTFATAENVPAGSSGAISTVEVPAASSGGKGKMIGVIVAIIVVVGGVFAWLHFRGSGTRNAEAADATVAPAQHAAVIFSAFQNTTGDPQLDGVLREALSLQLAQSPAVQVMPDSEIRSLMTRANLPPDAGFTADNIAKVATQVQARGVVTGSLSKSGGKYQLSATVTDPANNSQLAAVTETTDHVEHMADAASRLADKLRAALGESKESIRKFDANLTKSGTTNMAAMKAYVDGVADANGGKFADAALLLNQALTLDPKFALANLALADVYPRLGQPEKSITALDAAHRADSHLGPRARHYADALYAIRVTGDLDAAAKALNSEIADFPLDARSLAMLAELDLRIGNLSQALLLAQKLAKVSPTSEAGFALQQDALARLDRYTAAREIYNAGIKAGLQDSAVLHAQEVLVAHLLNDSSAENEQLQWAAGSPAGFLVTIAHGYALADSGEMSQAAAEWNKGAATARTSGLQDVAAVVQADEALAFALAGNCSNVASLGRTAASLDSGPGTTARVGIAYGLCHQGDAAGMASSLAKSRPQDTMVQQIYVPEMRGAAMLAANPAGAVKALEPAARYALASQSQYLTGAAYIAAKKPQLAPGALDNVLEHRGAFVAGRLLCYPMALAQMSRAYAATGDKLNAGKAAANFHEYWKKPDNTLSLNP